MRRIEPWVRTLRAGVRLALLAALSRACAANAQPYVYVANLGSDDVSVIDVASSEVVATLPAGDDPNGVAVSPNGRRAYVTNFLSGTLSIIDAGTNTVTSTVAVGDQPVGVALAPDGATAYVTNRSADTVAIVDTTALAVRSIVPVGDGPNAIALSPDGRSAYVTDSFTKFPGAVSVLDLATDGGTVRATVVVDRVPNRVAVSPDGTRAYVSHFRDWNLSVIDTATDAVIDTLRISRQPSSVAVNPNGAYVYVTGRGYADETDGNVQIVETATNRVTGSLLAGLDPRAIAVNRRGDLGYTADFRNNTVTVLDLGDQAVLGEIAVGDRPFALAVNCVGSECTAPPYTPKPTKTITLTPTVPTPTVTATASLTVTETMTPTRTATLRPGLEHVVIEIGGAQAAPGNRVPIEVVLHTGGQIVYGVTHDIVFTDFVGVAARAPGIPGCAPDAGVDGSVSFEYLPSPFDPDCSVDCAGLHVAVQARTPLADGAVLYRCAIQLASFAPIGTQRLKNDRVGATGPHGEVLATRGRDGIVSIEPGPTPPPEVFLQLGDIRARAGQRATLDVRVDTRGRQVAGVQNDIDFAPPIAIAARRNGQPDCTVNPAIDKNGTGFAFEPPGCTGAACTTARAVVLSVENVDPFADGALLYTCQVTIAADAAPGTYALGSSNLGASTPDGDAIPTGAVGGSVTVLGSALRERADTAGTAPGRPCTSEQQCPNCKGPTSCSDGLCLGLEGVCDGGADDGLLCDCPGGTCAAQPACGTDPQRGTCRGGARDGQCCDRSFNCGGGAACACTTLVCASGPSKGIPCLDDHHCIGAACTSGNGHCDAGAFRGSTCIDDRDCPLGRCVNSAAVPTPEERLPTPSTPLSTPEDPLRTATPTMQITPGSAGEPSPAPPTATRLATLSQPSQPPIIDRAAGGSSGCAVSASDAAENRSALFVVALLIAATRLRRRRARAHGAPSLRAAPP